MDVVPGPNNKYIEDTFETSYGNPFVGYVSADQQEFSISKQQMIDEISLNDLDEKNIRAYTQIELYVRPDDKVKNPNDVILNYNFNIFQTDIKEGDPVVNTPPSPKTFPPKQLSITLVGTSPNLQGDGPQIYNIKKPDGTFITFKFNTEDPYNPEFLTSFNIITANFGVPRVVTSNCISDSGTKYSQSCTVNELGLFKILLSYKPYGDDKPNGGEVLKQSVTSPPFTL